jgi:diguanylate cyclase (GGDEF)-like protein
VTITHCDVVARHGGVEFVVVLPGAGGERATIMCERLLAASRGMHPTVDGRDIVMTAFIGAAVPGEEHGVGGLQDVLKAADHTLYTAKRHGRNQGIFFSPVRPSARRTRSSPTMAYRQSAG